MTHQHIARSLLHVSLIPECSRSGVASSVLLVCVCAGVHSPNAFVCRVATTCLYLLRAAMEEDPFSVICAAWACFFPLFPSVRANMRLRKKPIAPSCAEPEQPWVAAILQETSDAMTNSEDEVASEGEGYENCGSRRQRFRQLQFFLLECARKRTPAHVAQECFTDEFMFNASRDINLDKYIAQVSVSLKKYANAQKTDLDARALDAELAQNLVIYPRISAEDYHSEAANETHNSEFQRLTKERKDLSSQSSTVSDSDVLTDERDEQTDGSNPAVRKAKVVRMAAERVQKPENQRMHSGSAESSDSESQHTPCIESSSEASSNMRESRIDRASENEQFFKQGCEQPLIVECSLEEQVVDQGRPQRLPDLQCDPRPPRQGKRSKEACVAKQPCPKSLIQSPSKQQNVNTGRTLRTKRARNERALHIAQRQSGEIKYQSPGEDMALHGKVRDSEQIGYFLLSGQAHNDVRSRPAATDV